jgi:peroxiredoxin
MKNPIAMTMILLTAAFSSALALSVGDKAPDFTLTTTDNASVKLSNSVGQVRVLLFFGCG